MDNLNNTIQARRVEQNNQEFYLGIFSIEQILTFTKFTERLIVNYDEENKPIYNDHIQRKVENPRVERIVDFLLDDPDALFPTNLVIAIPNAVIETFEETSPGIHEIKLSQRVFSEIRRVNGDVFLTIIDGQHRIKGIEAAIAKLESEMINLSQIARSSPDARFKRDLAKKTTALQNLKKIQLPVTFFIDPTLEFQAMVFSTINRTQKSVPQSLVYSLFGLRTDDSPQKTALQTVLTLNSFIESPFHNRIKLYGGKYERNQSPPLTQATMVKSIIDFISTNLRESEKDRFRERKDLKVNISDDFPFRKYYANDRDTLILDIMYSYFKAVQKTFQRDDASLWDFETIETKPTNILHTAVGYQALLDILKDILKEVKTDDERDKVATYKSYLQKAGHINVSDNARYPFTSKSKRIFYLDLSLAIWPNKGPEDNRRTLLAEALRQ
ncbi:DGQHR domain-containing protein [Pedobacter rhizosphaerae]|uniref:DGQHR domain-containing protein n=1 Tax=Pedobacter rhizosphaerae TaxID=390241 RepID=A0A1H9T2X0_9SPHI|nr:DGQHR domain-containing protein [Pedobacter rhizosphaerae]SER91079.1 DGQHR domain-containing protein [Pedobacter rhizosphaerae]